MGKGIYVDYSGLLIIPTPNEKLEIIDGFNEIGLETCTFNLLWLFMCQNNEKLCDNFLKLKES